MNITVSMNEDSQRILNMANGNSGKSNEVYLSELLEKYFKQQEKAIARQRLNRVKVSVHELVQLGQVFKSLEQAYNAFGLSEQVHVYGGIQKVYNDIYRNSGLILADSKIREQMAVVNPVKDVKHA